MDEEGGKGSGRGGGLIFLIRSLETGGSERVCVTLANAAVNAGKTVRVVVLHLGRGHLRDCLDRRVELTDLGATHARTAVVKLALLLIRKKPKVVLVFNHQLAVLMIALKAVLRSDVRIVARNISNLAEKASRERSFWHGKVVPSIVRVLYRKADAIICQASGMAKELKSEFGIVEGRIRVIPNPLAPEFEQSLDGPAPIDPPEPRILFVGRLERVKGIHDLIDAFGRMLPRHPEAKLVLVGDGSLRRELDSRVRSMGLSASVVFKGECRDLIGEYRSARVTALTSEYEGFPNVLLESISQGTPVVSYDCPSGPREIVLDGENGYLVPSGDIGALAEKLSEILGSGFDRERVRATADPYRSERIVPRYFEILLSL